MQSTSYESIALAGQSSNKRVSITKCGTTVKHLLHCRTGNGPLIRSYNAVISSSHDLQQNNSIFFCVHLYNKFELQG